MVSYDRDRIGETWRRAAGVKQLETSNLEICQQQRSQEARWGSVAEHEQKFTFAPPHRWNPKCFKLDWNLSFPSAGQACDLENAVELLDQAGEWYLDRHTGVLSYWPRPGEEMNDAQAVRRSSNRRCLP